MDHVKDLTARAVSFISFVQDIFLNGAVQRNNALVCTSIAEVFGPGFKECLQEHLATVKNQEQISAKVLSQTATANKASLCLGVEKKVLELVWLSQTQPLKEDASQCEEAEQYLLAICDRLSVWISKYASSFVEDRAQLFDAFATPQTWRNAISRSLYQKAERRVALAKALEYIPVQLVLALGGCEYNVHEQRILQWWQTGELDTDIPLTAAEHSFRHNFLQVCYKSFDDERAQANKGSERTREDLETFYRQKIELLLTNYAYVAERLLVREAPLSFPFVFAGEMNEIEKNREVRRKECLMKEMATDDGRHRNNGKKQLEPAEQPEDSRGKEKNCNPAVTAEEMKLFALTFSGGGIRSATFNLGILQGLAKKGVLGHVDYLSTVSGGGYIGSWLTTWIKRSGSLSKVQDYLNPDVSADPMAEEVRPIRWLRMFSNYLAPNKSIMSVDSWTIGVTWLRNTLLNQVVILLMLLSMLLLFWSAFELWSYPRAWQTLLPGTAVYMVACGLLLAFAYFTGIGMRWYHRIAAANDPSPLHQKQVITPLIAGIAITGAFLVSASMYQYVSVSFWQRLIILLPAAGVTFIVLLMVAWIGRYVRCIKSYQPSSPVGKWQIRPYLILMNTALLAAGVGWLALAGAWKVLDLLKPDGAIGSKLGFAKPAAPAFTVGVPLVLLVMGITVVARMGFLGRYFPDERREWWGRMGAVINRIALIWLLIGASTTLLRDVVADAFSDWEAPATFGGWMALVGGAVNAAFSGKTSGKTEAKGAKGIALDLLSKAGPYLFALGLLVFLPALLKPLLNRPLLPGFIEERTYLKAIIYAVVLLLLALYLSRRLGVNEFSMHHFYRNRLVRAYLGATRPRIVRDKTANPFTGFDKFDDEKLSLFRHCQGYYGPYPVLNAALNASQVTDLSRQDRKAESFIFSPLYSGFDFSRVRSSANLITKSYDYGYRPTQRYAYPNDKGPGIGTAMAISGAAANANQGFHSSAGTAFLLTVFNAQLGWWIGNPRKSKWKESDPSFGLAYVLKNLVGQTNTHNNFVCLSDGGHFDNMGLYEMIRRRCAVIVVCDGEQDENFTCEGLANAIRRCRVDFGAEIVIDVDDITQRDGRFSKQHYAVGTICYSGESTPSGTLLYVKASITGEEPVDVKEYALKNEAFPHQSTGDQFFDEQQFESYRKLGMHVADNLLQDQKVVDALKLNFRVAGHFLNVQHRARQRVYYAVRRIFK